MGVLDKIKNALFEVEYVEVEEPVKKEKKLKSKNKDKNSSNKPIAKKVVLPGKKEEKIEELKEEELRDEDFEVRPKDETLKKNNPDDFKFMDDNDFKVEKEDSYNSLEPEILEVISNDEEKYGSRVEGRREKRQDREKIKEKYNKFDDNDNSSKDYEYLEDHSEKYYNNPEKKSLHSNYDSKPYGMDSSYSIPMHEYGTYEKKEEKNYFKPSPIISPIYGILDKNYKKEDVVQKKEIRLTTNFSRSNISVDDIRNKAYGESDSVEKEEDNITTFEVDDEDDDNLLVDLSDEKEKPEVKELTMGDALEYFQDLGLEYNVDYVDASKEKVTARRSKNNYDEIADDNIMSDDTNDNVTSEIAEEDRDVEEMPKTSSVVQIKEESKDSDSLDDDDNLFDLIDSMYQEND